MVGVIDADLGVNVDLRSSERTYQLLEQVSGRAGRGDKKGRVYLQSYNTNHPVIKSLVNRDIDGFINNELKSREMLHMPPYGRLAGLVISGLNEQKVMELSENIVRVAKKYQKVIEVFGPIPALIFRLKTKYRFRVLMKSKKDIKLQKVISDILKEINIPSSLKIKIDIDPYNFM
ncbi:MAG: Primosomal protein N' [Alphaproteobacteria bacterium ADurb.Bin438]|nr:MAG: Primosomal protein N' [Alphaproteobacteria bacterium ADurb.Bin438]